MAGYSGTPLVHKLGFKPGMRVAIHDPPAGFRGELPDLPAVTWVRGLEHPLDLILLFVRDKGALQVRFPSAAAALGQGGMLWISWPKKASKVPTDLTEDVIREIGLDEGLVDVKVCAVNDVWSGLKFVRRKAVSGER